MFSFRNDLSMTEHWFRSNKKKKQKKIADKPVYTNARKFSITGDKLMQTTASRMYKLLCDIRAYRWDPLQFIDNIIE